MPISMLKLVALTVTCVVLSTVDAAAQVVVSPYERVSGRSNAALQYFGGAQFQPVVQQPARQGVSNLGRSRPAAVAKPFANLDRSPALSPYLNLDVREDGAIPSYYLFVEPQLRQQEALQAQRAQLNRLEQQVRVAGATGATTGRRPGGAPTTGQSRQFLNTGGFFPPVR